MKDKLIAKAKKMIKKSRIINPPSNTDFPKKEITVVIPCYNSLDSIGKSIDSVINQTFPFEKVQVIVVDDGSTDGTSNLLEEYSSKYSNITVIYLHKNTGTAGMPRNIGIEFTNTDYVMFLDSDDWLSNNALLTLINTLEKNDDDFVVGKTIKVTDKGEQVHAEFISYEERIHQHPLDIPYLIYHMGPPSKLMKTSILKKNNIRFPEWKFAEDKYFFINVLSHCNWVSTITEPICYINRLPTNETSLTKSVSLLNKRKADFEALKDLLKQDFEVNYEKEIVKRIIEYDLIRGCNTLTFINSDQHSIFIGIIRKSFKLLKGKTYSVFELIESPLYAVAARLIEEEMDQDVISLFSWNKKENNKQVKINENTAYYVVSKFHHNHPYRLIPIPLYIRSAGVSMKEKVYIDEVRIYGEKINSIESVIIRDKKNRNNDLVFPVKILDNHGKIEIPLYEVNKLEQSLFSIFMRYDGYKLINIKTGYECSVKKENKKISFYSTRLGNLGLSISVDK